MHARSSCSRPVRWLAGTLTSILAVGAPLGAQRAAPAGPVHAVASGAIVQPARASAYRRPVHDAAVRGAWIGAGVGALLAFAITTDDSGRDGNSRRFGAVVVLAPIGALVGAVTGAALAAAR